MRLGTNKWWLLELMTLTVDEALPSAMVSITWSYYYHNILRDAPSVAIAHTYLVDTYNTSTSSW